MASQTTAQTTVPSGQNGQPQTQTPAPVTGTPSGNPIQNVDPNIPSSGYQTVVNTPDNVVAMIEKARQDERQKVYSTMEKLKADVKQRDASMVEMQSQLTQLQTLVDKDLPKDEKIRRQIDSLQEQIKAEKIAREQAEARSSEAVLRAELETYKNQRLMQVGSELIPELVGGGSREAIDASIMVAQAEYHRLRGRFENEFAARYQMQGQVQQPVQQQQPVGVPAPQNPYFTPPPSTGFPSAVSPVPVSEPGPDLNAIANLTTEDAVRSGHYEQYRAQLLQQIKEQGRTPQAVGSSPRFMGQMPSAAVHSTPHVPGVFQSQVPQGYPTGPAMPPSAHHNAAVVQGAQIPGPMGNQAVNDPRAAAYAAVNRTNAGQNPLVNQQQGKAPPGPMPAGNATDAMSAFSSRFQPTPPLSTGQ